MMNTAAAEFPAGEVPLQTAKRFAAPITVAGMFNVRDFGGLETVPGRRIKPGRVFRSDDLSGLTSRGKAALEERGIRTVVDFRGDDEVRLAPDRLPDTVQRTVRLPIEPGNVLELTRLTCETAPEMMCELYRVLARDAQEMYWEFFRLLSNPENSPLLFHCSAGKDRTGFAAALFLLSLGAPRETVRQDYLLSARLVREKYRSAIEADERFASIYTVRPEYLAAAFEVIDREFGGTEHYLRNCLGIDTALMRELYTQAE
ncbi:tyrosine-protein phosphatase [uncultured Victivallis sp.]|uniref:tyrosine-protein phosphatase n=1 Tax=uncultured Victivallis sp. TaxID=354118 RepID=UPI0025F4F89A|nr:tyrosine-protein phosphatase [uncultured Victivallis sp.]